MAWGSCALSDQTTNRSLWPLPSSNSVEFWIKGCKSRMIWVVCKNDCRQEKGFWLRGKEMVNANLMAWQVGLIDPPLISNYLYIPYIQHSLRACVKNMITFYTRYKKSSFGSSSSFIADLRERPDMSILIVSGRSICPLLELWSHGKIKHNEKNVAQFFTFWQLLLC